jgi:hypothetical protein
MPEDIIVCEEDGPCRLILLQAGILGDFERRLAPGQNACTYYHRGFTLHGTVGHLVAQYFTGFRNPADNGYFLVFVPASLMSWDQFTEEFVRGLLIAHKVTNVITHFPDQYLHHN